jgi:pyruvate dehydrogenase E2 component (dihydrolipoamide acetyltransferase)
MTINPIRMPKWGLSMQEGVIVDWLKPEGSEVAAGEELVEIETAKIVNVAESPAAGVLRRVLASAGETLPVGALIGVLAETATPDADIDAFVADFQASFVPGEAGEADPAALQVQTIQVGERMIRYGRAGPSSGTPAVLIHGFAADLNGWLFNLEALAADRPVYALDLPGHGGSTKDVGDGGLAALAEVVEGWLSALGVDRAHLVGHSLGAAVAARFALDHPDRVASLGLVAPAYLGGAVNADFLSGVVQARRARDLKPWLEMLTADPALITRDMVEDVLKAKRLDGVDEALGTLRDRLVEGADAAALRADLPRIPAALVVTSAADRIVGRTDEAALPQSWRVVEVAGAGHLPHLEQAVQVNAELRAWMTERG